MRKQSNWIADALLNSRSRRAGKAKLLVRNTSSCRYRIFESDSTQWRVEILLRVKAREHDSLIADQSCAAVDGMGIAALGFEIGLGAGDKETLRLVQLIKPIEIDVTSVHDVESAWLGHQQIENVDVVQFAVADVNERRDVASQIQAACAA